MKRTLFIASLIGAVAFAAPAIAGPYVATVVASGLNNPRGLAFGPDGGLYIAESGFFQAGGPTTIVRGQVGTYSETGSITRVLGGQQQRIVTGLASLSVPFFNDTSGPNDIAFGADGTGYVWSGSAPIPLSALATSGRTAQSSARCTASMPAASRASPTSPRSSSPTIRSAGRSTATRIT